MYAVITSDKLQQVLLVSENFESVSTTEKVLSIHNLGNNEIHDTEKFIVLEFIESPEKLAILNNLGALILNNQSEYFAWIDNQTITMTPGRLRVTNRINRCKAVKMRFLEENQSVTITPEQSGALLNAFKDVLLLLDVGEARTALGIVSQIPAETFVLTEPYNSSEERKQSYVNDLQQIVTDLFE